MKNMTVKEYLESNKMSVTDMLNLHAKTAECKIDDWLKSDFNDTLNQIKSKILLPGMIFAYCDHRNTDAMIVYAGEKQILAWSMSDCYVNAFEIKNNQSFERACDDIDEDVFAAAKLVHEKSGIDSACDHLCVFNIDGVLRDMLCGDLRIQGNLPKIIEIAQSARREANNLKPDGIIKT